ncbi:MAG: Cell division topological determinant MinJ [Pelotomaculum sp. PtaB.Bin104]|nr:MAG: Cell division topological determinant MinJ [Pelotomaculum sp. PtaB.Bin104]
MFPFAEVLPLIIQIFLQTLTDLQFLPLYLMVVTIIAMQYRRAEKIKKDLFGVKAGGFWADVFMSTGFGLLGGLVGSILMVFIGLSLSESGLIYLWPLAILLMLINVRFLCFAYSGGLLSLSSLLLGFPQVSVPQIMALVAVLHMVESLLILAGGHLGAAPAYIKGAAGRVTGGFTLQKFWPIPLVVLAAAGAGPLQGAVEMPQWWPLIKAVPNGDAQNMAYMLMPVIAGLGYGDVAIARNPLEKSRQSAIYLGLYSLALLIMAVLAGKSSTVMLAAALFSPLGHEAVVLISRRSEFMEKPLYVAPGRGVRILDVLPGGIAWRAGIRSGDIILAINGVGLGSKSELEQLQQSATYPQTVDYYSYTGGQSRRGVFAAISPGRQWGMLPVPEENEDTYIELLQGSLFGRWLKKLWSLLRVKNL